MVKEKKRRLPLLHEVVDKGFKAHGITPPSENFDKVLQAFNIPTPSETADIFFGTREERNEKPQIKQNEGRKQRQIGLSYKMTVPQSQENNNNQSWDVFICHASEDKEWVNRLADALMSRGIRVWYDKFELTLGDSIRRKIDYGLTNSRFGVVVLSRNFFTKEFPQRELDGLAAKESNGRKVILPIWHGISRSDIEHYSPILADRVAVSSEKGIDIVANEIEKATKSIRDPLSMSWEPDAPLENGFSKPIPLILRCPGAHDKIEIEKASVKIIINKSGTFYRIKGNVGRNFYSSINPNSSHGGITYLSYDDKKDLEVLLRKTDQVPDKIYNYEFDLTFKYIEPFHY